MQNDSNAFSFNGSGAHQGDSKTPYALSSKVVPGMTGAQKPLFVNTSLGTFPRRANAYSIKVVVQTNYVSV